MKIGMVNAGNLGMSLAVPWVKQGHDVMLSKDTHPDQLQQRMRAFSLEHGLSEAEIEKFKYGSLADAANFGQVVISSVYFPRLDHVLNELRSVGITFAGKIIVETMNALNVDADFNHYHDFEYMKRTSITEEIQKAFPEAVLFQSFNQIPATLLDSQKWT